MEMLEGSGINLAEVFKQMLSSVPLWFLLFFILKGWLKSKADADKNIKSAIAGLHEKINRIEMTLASEGLSDLKENIDTLKESRVKHETQIQNILRMINGPRSVKS